MAGEPELRKGLSSEWVRYLQRALQSAGYWNGELDGAFDDDLESAVIAFQNANGLPADGIVRADTWEALVGESKRTIDFAPSDFPEIRALATADDFDGYTRDVVGVDPDTLKDESEPIG